MAPRNNDTDTSYHKKNCEAEIDIKNLIPNLMHKKHKVVKLVKCQLKKIQEEGLSEFDRIGSSKAPFFCDSGKGLQRTCDCKSSKNLKARGLQVETRCMESSSEPSHTTNHNSGFCCFYYTLAFLLAMFLLILLIIWISSGPLSNSISHTPIPSSSFVRTDNICSLEKKYLLRWSNFD